MARPAPSERRFTVEEANRALPYLRRIVDDIVAQTRLVDELRDRLRFAKPSKSNVLPDPYREELASSQAELERQEATLRGYVRELEATGVKLKGPEGLCDFPGRLDGRDVAFCWSPADPEVQFWHELDEEASDRKPLAASAVAAPPGGDAHAFPG